MKSLKEWYSAKELEGIDGLPNLATNITRKAKTEKWIKRERAVQGGGYEYHYSSLPEETQKQLGFKPCKQLKASSSIFETVKDMQICNGELKENEYAFRSDWLAKKGLDHTKLAIMRMKDDTMEPTICKGDTLLVSTFFHWVGNNIKQGLEQSEIDDLIDGLYVVRINDRLSIKRLQIDIQGNFKIICDNPLYENIEITKADFNPSIVVGRLEWLGRTFE
ncbi:DNA-binding protein [Pasteurella skyensis]|uniref:DNA-binding protein n=1 Tax=Phocoenobacter skyensis TaxID=97481 RepID=A0AAJ6P360_9PAST|nr:DNA-binding protein [Pasteurella skyensis]MDP8171512.1 DNA-binding protein [Pasteurella skyensis]MDP8175414.1 DNA-binding protein [Pasteurella skyensis]